MEEKRNKQTYFSVKFECLKIENDTEFVAKFQL